MTRFLIFAVFLAALAACTAFDQSTRTDPAQAVQNSPAWSPTLGATGVPNTGIPYLNRPGRFYGSDYCSVDGWGIPAGQIDDEHADHVDDPACRQPIDMSAGLVSKQ